MHWVTVEGHDLPKLIGGHPALELCNTYAGWDEPPHPRAEWLRDPDTMLVWCMHAGVVTPDVTADLRDEARSRPAKARSALDRVRRFRADLYVSLVHDDGEAFDRVAEVAHRSARTARLVRRTDGGVRGSRARWELSPDLGLDLPLLALAARAADLLVSDERGLVRACPGDECGWLFLDRRGTRRWCSMQTCGNRAKARAFAARHRDRG